MQEAELDSLSPLARILENMSIFLDAFFLSTPQFIINQLEHILVIDAQPWDSLPAGCSSFKSLYTDDGLSCPSLSSLPDYDPAEVAVIHWTSGTTVRLSPAD